MKENNGSHKQCNGAKDEKQRRDKNDKDNEKQNDELPSTGTYRDAGKSKRNKE
jgi:hypothetical protein